MRQEFQFNTRGISGSIRTSLFAMALLFLASCTQQAPTDEADVPATSETIVTLSEAQLANAGIVTGKMEQRSLGVLMPVQGVVDVPPQNLVSVSAPLGGYLRSTDLLPGMEVQTGTYSRHPGRSALYPIATGLLGDARQGDHAFAGI